MDEFDAEDEFGHKSATSGGVFDESVVGAARAGTKSGLVTTAAGRSDLSTGLSPNWFSANLASNPLLTAAGGQTGLQRSAERAPGMRAHRPRAAGANVGWWFAQCTWRSLAFAGPQGLGAWKFSTTGPPSAGLRAAGALVEGAAGFVPGGGAVRAYGVRALMGPVGREEIPTPKTIQKLVRPAWAGRRFSWWPGFCVQKQAAAAKFVFDDFGNHGTAG